MDIKTLKKYIALAKKEGLKSLSFESEGAKLSFELQGVDEPFPQKIVEAKPSSVLEKTGPKKSTTSSYHEIKAPFVGTFYSAPGPGQSDFVKVGDQIRSGKTLCILEAMKIMNEIEADISGEIVEICVENEDFVEFGQVLFRIK